MKKLLVILTLLPMMAFGFTGPNSHQIMGEFEALTTLIEITKPDYEVGGYFQGKDFKNDVKLLWRLTGDTDSHQTIRLIRRRESGVMFAVTYHLTKYIVDGRLVLRRFV